MTELIQFERAKAEIAKAQANVATTMPCVGVAQADIIDGAPGGIVFL